MVNNNGSVTIEQEIKALTVIASIFYGVNKDRELTEKDMRLAIKICDSLLRDYVRTYWDAENGLKNTRKSKERTQFSRMKSDAIEEILYLTTFRLELQDTIESN